jgi:surfeit locus 1 family protein
MRLTWWAVARRPKWLLALGGFLVIVAVFSALAQWQWQRSIDEATVIERDTEIAVALESVAIPQSTITTDASGRMVSVECQIIESDDVWVTNRAVPGDRGDWLVRHCVTPQGHSLAVVVGWAPVQFEGPYPDTSGVVIGRYVPTESPQTSDFEAGRREVIAIGEMVNLWANPGPVYGGFVVMDAAPEPLRTIPTEAPPTDASLNILNIFYSIQWLIFALFALYFWYRLVKDELEKELDASAQDAQTPTK